MIMEAFDRSSYPDSLHSGHGHPRDWIAKPYSIVSTGVVVAEQIEPYWCVTNQPPC